ncbi:hypothetical protein ETP1_034 [Edwardsiella phage ETP-1]|uniref:Uncharacterized protein n=3 Tax=Kafunavirus KF1 TaxID=1982588 RepID=A0A6G5P4A4_9CAUD|nr:hypothetical protein D877_gp36 [Edwardsiella phage KF-1]QBP07035.1 hypothetical protein ETP1_034 [Edwardsiella phage ETP-1]UIS54090.1 putative tail fiber assembly protein [Edwardsiella phage vB_EpP_ZHX]BAM63084.1 hypothetical protein [Edwardsiella phage KF-1]BAM63133.1 hypothetical protein [Edwardsiella phage IW-1]
MDKETERELERLKSQLDGVETKQEEQDSKLGELSKNVLRFWHIGMGLGLGFLAERLGLEKLLSKFL